MTERQVKELLDHYDRDDLDIAFELCDRHDPAAIAASFVDHRDMSIHDLSFGELAEKSARLAAALRARGVDAGDRVAVLLSKREELLVSLVALWRLGAVHVPLFTAFATGAIEMRLTGSGARLVITEASESNKLSSLDVDVIDVDSEYIRLLEGNVPLTQSISVGGNGPFIQLYTSGTTGKPKGVAVPGRALAAFCAYFRYGLDVQPMDVYWNAADPGWAYGLYYGVVAPLASGTKNIFLSGGFAAASTTAVLRDLHISNFAAAPTIYRALSQLPEGSLPHLRRASSAGEPLSPDVVEWGQQQLGVEIRDHYGQTEVGMVLANGWHEDVIAPVKQGSMGRALPGFVAGIQNEQIAVDVTASPLLWFTGYVDDPTKRAERFTSDGRWYLTSDTGRIDEDGYAFFQARDDDVILAAGYRIGPSEVENVIVRHPAVSEVAVVGRPDPEGIRGEIVEAFVVVTPGAQSSESLARELQNLVRTTYSKHAYPRQVRFVDALPRTPSGKIQRFLLRAATPR